VNLIEKCPKSMSAPPPDEFPIRIGTPTEFARARDFFGNIEFNERAAVPR